MLPKVLLFTLIYSISAEANRYVLEFRRLASGKFLNIHFITNPADVSVYINKFHCFVFKAEF